MTVLYELHGLIVDSEIELPRKAGEGAAADLEVRYGSERPAAVAPAGETIAEFDADERRIYIVVRTGPTTVVHVPNIADFDIDIGGRRMVVHRDPAARMEYMSLLLAGTVISVALALQGHCVLHASAVETSRGAVLFAGMSGMGKSTCAAMACAAGFKLVADDVLRLELDHDAVVAIPGSPHLRLKSKAEVLVDAFPQSVSRWRTADNRLAIAPPSTEGSLPVAGIVIPRPTPGAQTPTVERRTASGAFPSMLAFSRINSWREPELVRQHFEQTAELSRRVPVFDAVIPWGPPFDSTQIEEVIGDVLRGSE